jgi:hypothetical protein
MVLDGYPVGITVKNNLGISKSDTPTFVVDQGFMRSFVTKGHKCGFGTSKWGPNSTQSIVKLGNEKNYRKYEELG